MRVRAFAKINLSLRVLGTRADGYHELRTMFQSIALHDTLTFARVRGPFALDVRRSGVSGRRHESGLARGGSAMWRRPGAAARRAASPIDLAKRIPMQAGLGGGSSDAAAALRALCGAGVSSDAKVRAAAIALGADVPYFLGRRHVPRPRPRRCAVSVCADRPPRVGGARGAGVRRQHERRVRVV